MTPIQNKALTALTFASAASLAIAAFAAPGLANDSSAKDAPKVEKKIIRVITVDENGKEKTLSETTVGGGERKIHVMAMGHDCHEGTKMVDSATESKDDGKTEKTRILMCSKGPIDKAKLAERLKAARERLAAENELTEAARAKAIAALDAEIAKLTAK